MSIQYDPNPSNLNGLRRVDDGLGDCGCPWPLAPLREGEKRTNETLRPIGPRRCGCLSRRDVPRWETRNDSGWEVPL